MLELYHVFLAYSTSQCIQYDREPTYTRKIFDLKPRYSREPTTITLDDVCMKQQVSWEKRVSEKPLCDPKRVKGGNLSYGQVPIM